MTDSHGANEMLRLAQVSLFAGLDAGALEQIARATHVVRAERDALFFAQGDAATNLYILRTGQVRIQQLTPEGSQVLLRYIQPGQMFGGIAAFGLKEYPASAQASESAEAWVWNGEQMRDFMRHVPQLALNALDHTAETIQALQDRVRELQTERVERRVARALLRLVRQSGKRVENGILIDFPLSRQDLAEMTGTNLYSVSRILSAWEKQGLLQSGRERIVLCVPHKLVIIAEDLPMPHPPDAS